MSNNTRHKTTIMPKITQSIRMERRNLNERKSYTRKEDIHYFKNSSSNVPELIDAEKKPGSSIDRKKPIYIFPKITSTKVPPGTANAITSMDPISYKINYSHGIKVKKSLIDETDKDEHIPFSNNINNSKININIKESKINHNPLININDNSNNFVEEKKFVNNKIAVDINNYKDISINFLINNSELSEMFEKLYKNDYNAKKKWVELYLFGREVFKIRLETYIKNKMDIPSFIKNEINKLLSNQYCDYVFKQSYKQIEEQCDEHLKNIENIYN